MAIGLALTIGLNSVDPKHYSGWSGDLNACESDASDMAHIASSRGFKATKLLTSDATKKQVSNEIKKASQKLKTGDIFMLSYSGHGGTLPDLNDDEPDDQDETWCLYDEELVDDELNLLLAKFAPGVRILTFSDSCHSGTVTKTAFHQPFIDMLNSNVGANGTKYRFMPASIALNTYRDNRERYNRILKDPKLATSEDMVRAPVLLISGCQDNQLSADGTFNGLFTSQLSEVWNDGTFKGRYRKFHKEITNRMPPQQTPNYYLIGTRDLQFEKQKPFTI